MPSVGNSTPIKPHGWQSRATDASSRRAIEFASEFIRVDLRFPSLLSTINHALSTNRIRLLPDAHAAIDEQHLALDVPRLVAD